MGSFLNAAIILCLISAPATEEPSFEKLRAAGAKITRNKTQRVTAIAFPSCSDVDLCFIAESYPLTTRLHLSGSRVTDASVAKIPRLSRLSSVSLADTDVSDASVVHLATLKELKELHVDGTAISDAAIDALVQMESLEKLNVGRTNVSLEGRRRLRIALPHATVFPLDPPFNPITEPAVATVENVTKIQPRTKIVVREVRSDPNWGTLRGRFLYDGPIPDRGDVRRGPQNANRDKSLLINPTNRGIANVIVYLYQKRGSASPPIHSTHAAKTQAPIRLKTDGANYEPRILVVRTGQTIELANHGQRRGTVLFSTLANDRSVHTTPPGRQSQFTLEKPETLPVPFFDTGSPGNVGYLVVKDHPYVAVSDRSGFFEMKNIPVGHHSFQVWHEACGYVKRVSMDAGGETEWRRGRFSMAIRSDRNELGTISVPHALMVRDD